MDTGDLIPPSLPLQKGEIPPLWQRGVRGDFGRICLINYGLLSNSRSPGTSEETIPEGQAGVAKAAGRI